MKPKIAAGIIAVMALYLFSMLYSYYANPAQFTQQLFYFGIITFVLVSLILTFDKLTLECVHIDKPVIIGIVVSVLVTLAVVYFTTSKSELIAAARLSSLFDVFNMPLHQLLFVGVGEGILHYFFIRVAYAAKKNWGFAAIVASAILAVGHKFAPTMTWGSVVFLFFLFMMFAALSMFPRMLGSKVKYSLPISASSHMTWNYTLPIVVGVLAL